MSVGSEVAKMDNGTGVGGADALSLVSTLLSDPKTVSRLMSVLSEHSAKSEDAQSVEGSGVPEENAESSEGAEVGESAKNAETLERLSGVLSSISAPENARASSPTAKHTALLLAVKPYLSPRRAELIDELLRLGDLGEIFRKLGGGGG